MRKERLKLYKRIALTVVIVLAAIFGAFFVYAADYYRAEEPAVLLYEDLLESNVLTEDNNTVVFTPENKNGIGIIFYPGAKVEEIAYTPLLDKLREQGFTCVMVKMPFHMAIFNPDAADKIYGEFLEINTWYICGHSMGGAMASNYMASNADKIEGLILLGAYIYGDVSSKDALTIYGTFNSNLEENIDYEENIVVIDGGNHAGFGNYGIQKGDPIATITAEEQQEITVKAIVEFIDSREKKGEKDDFMVRTI